MRILRGKSNLEVSSQGFALFVVGLVLATFIGGAIRTILRSDQVNRRIVAELRARFPRNDFKIGHTEVLLSRGLWPGFALRLNDVDFSQDVCGKLSFALHIPTAVLPVDLLSLRKGEVRLGRAEIRGGKIRLDYRHCPPPGDEGAPVAAAAPVTATAGALPRGFAAPRLDWAAVARGLSGLDLADFEVTYAGNPTWKLIFKEASTDFRGDEMNLRARVDAQKSLPFGALSHPVTLELRGDKQILSWDLRTEFKEGRLNWKGSWDLQGNAGLSRARLVQIPLQDLSGELFQMGLLQREIKLRTAWLTCDATWEGEMDHFDAMPVRLRGCKIEGAYGRVDLERADVFLAAAEPLKMPARFKVQKLQLQPLIEALGRQVLPAVLARLGTWSGEFDYGGAGHWRLDGELDGVEVVFSNQSVRGKQILNSIHTVADRQGGEINAVIDGVRLQGGDFSGRASLRLSGDWRSGGFELDIARLGFGKNIQNLLIGGEIAPLSIRGRGNLQAGELSHWSGRIETSHLSADGWSAENLSADSKFSSGVVHLAAHAAHASADSRWRFYPQLRQARENAGDTLSWRNLKMDMRIQSGGGRIDSVSGVEGASGALWRGKGAWVRDGEMTALLAIGRPGRGQKMISVHGRKGDLMVEDARPGGL